MKRCFKLLVTGKFSLKLKMRILFHTVKMTKKKEDIWSVVDDVNHGSQKCIQFKSPPIVNA